MTSRCTRACKYCFVRQRKQTPPDPTIEMLLRGMVVLEKLGFRDVQVTGGEILLRKDIPTIIEALFEHDFSIAISTNGDLLSEELATAIFTFPIRSINFSLDSHKKEVFDSIRGKGAYDNTLNALKICRTFDTRIRIQSVLTNLNKDHIHEVPYFLHKQNIDLHVISGCVEKVLEKS